MPRMLARLRDVAHRCGIEVGRFPPQVHDRRRGELLTRIGAELVIDVGANVGQYASTLRSVGGYRERIISLEPVSDAFTRLEHASAGDARWDCRRLALMDVDGEMTLHVADRDELSSFNESSAAGRAALSEVRTKFDETVPTARLDTVYESLAGDRRAFLKLDVQGSEPRVLDGAERCLSYFIGLQLELPLVPLYEGQVSAGDLIARLEAAGMRLVSVQPLFFDACVGLNLEFDAIFLREDVLARLVADR